MGDIKNKRVSRFLEDKNGDLKIIRSVLLFGKNVYSYKFPFCEALLTIGEKEKFHQDEVFDPFLNALLRHMKKNPIQYQGGAQNKEPSLFMRLCVGYLEGKVEKSNLESEAEKVIPKNVFAAFQNLGGGTLSEEARLYDFDTKSKIFHLRPNLLNALANPSTKKLIEEENEARWRVVEEAWRVGLPVGTVSLNNEDKILYHDYGTLRIPLRSAVDHLMPYQKGKCFFCQKKLNRFASRDQDDFPDVDHYFSLNFLSSLGKLGLDYSVNPNGIWNLVVACKECNRGSAGKFVAVPSSSFLARLVERNECFVEEHKHVFRFAIFESMGIKSANEIKERLVKIDGECIASRWAPKRVY